jgi:hypothetical protein
MSSLLASGEACTIASEREVLAGEPHPGEISCTGQIGCAQQGHVADRELLRVKAGRVGQRLLRVVVVGDREGFLFVALSVMNSPARELALNNAPFSGSSPDSALPTRSARPVRASSRAALAQRTLAFISLAACFTVNSDPASGRGA